MTNPKRLAAMGGGAGPATYIEDVFSTWLYTGTGSSQTITNGIDLSGKGGLVWIKSRNDTYDHFLYDTLRGATKSLQSNTTTAEQTYSDSLTAFNSTGFALGANVRMNANTTTYASWTFREQAKFFDVVTFTTNSSGNASFNHALESTPGCILFKTTNLADDWYVWHRSTGNNQYLQLNTTIAAGTASGWCSPTSTGVTTANGFLYPSRPYVAYLFAHDAGGFGPAGTDNVITCGSFTCDGSGNFSVNLGYEPQWVLLKATNAVEDWYTTDNMRGWNAGGWTYLIPNSSAAEASATNLKLNATGFSGSSSASRTYIYIAIRRGPMKTPTSGTSVFSPVTYVGDGSTTTGQLVNAGFTVDMGINRYNRAGAGDWDVVDRLRGLTSIGVSSNSRYLNPYSTSAEASGGYIFDATNTSVDMYGFSASFTQLNYLFRRAPGFFDVVCYTGTGSTRTVTHNLGVAPELLIIKRRTSSGGSFTDNWVVWSANATPQQNQYSLSLNLAGPWTTLGDKYWGATTTGTPSMTASSFSLGDFADVNANAATYVAYLFASVTSVSKVGGYTGNGSSQTINCGFTTGARFVLIKRTDVSGPWHVWDTARGIVSGNDPYLFLNSTAAETTTNDSIDPDNSGFIVNQLVQTDINVSSATYIYLAIA